MAGTTRNDSDRRMTGRSTAALRGARVPLGMLFGLIAGAAQAEALVFPAGNYALVAQMIMPHLDEMRRVRTEETQCLGGDEPGALFPVLRQPALRGCRLAYETRSEETRDYVLECASARVASGRANLRLASGRITGMLEVKMGGKNMTFSQRVVATPQGDCSIADAPGAAAGTP